VLAEDASVGVGASYRPRGLSRGTRFVFALDARLETQKR